MLSTFLVAALALAAPTVAYDTTFAVPRDARIHLQDLNGSVEVRTWDRDAVRITVDTRAGDRIEVRTVGSAVNIKAVGRFGLPRSVDYVVTIPARAALRVTGPFSEVSVVGAGGDVFVETVRGDVHVRGGAGIIELRSVQGELVLEDARGSIFLAGVNEGIRASRVSGPIRVETVNGEIRLERIDSGDVVASTVNGAVSYQGVIRDDGRYSLTTHNGSVTIDIPDGTNATLSVSTFNGVVDFGLPVALTDFRRGERFNVTLGRGTARIDLESFNGAIRIRRSTNL